MTQTISQTQITQAVLFLLDETFQNVHGVYLDKGTSLFETLATISAEEASIPVGGKCATLAAQVEHVNFYLEVLSHYLQSSENKPVDWGEIWRRVKAVTPEEWSNSQHKLQQTYRQLLELVRNYEDWGRENAIGGAIGLVAHTAYHLGEIRQALCVLKT
jgi:hypothetical protein